MKVTEVVIEDLTVELCKTVQIRVTWKRGKAIAYPSPKLSVDDTQDSYYVRSSNNVRCVG